MLWGCRKFSKKLIQPDHVPSSEFLNFLSRVPDEVTVRKCKQLSIKDPVLVAKEDERRVSRDGNITTSDTDNVLYFLPAAKPSRSRSGESPSSSPEKESHRVPWRLNCHGINGDWTYQVHG